mgnify:CR=1 FL=1
MKLIHATEKRILFEFYRVPEINYQELCMAVEKEGDIFPKRNCGYNDLTKRVYLDNYLEKLYRDWEIERRDGKISSRKTRLNEMQEIKRNNTKLKLNSRGREHFGYLINGLEWEPDKPIRFWLKKFYRFLRRL